jgi:hypothetical protein
MSKVVAEEQNCYLVSAENLQANPDGIHINAESQRQFGNFALPLRLWTFPD